MKRGRGRPKNQPAFARVQRAKEVLAQSTVRAARLVVRAATIAAEKGDSSPAEFILKHVGMPDDQGKLVRPLVTSVDRLEVDSASKVPTINIGWITTGQQPTLPSPSSSNVIDVRALPAKAENIE